MGRLYLCATPIGNLEDISLRALRILGEVAWIAAEDTRQTMKLLRRYEIATPVISYHEHNEEERATALVERLIAGEDGALVSDAGTPAISDPGYPLVQRAIEAGVPVIPVPGPSAVIAALIVSGLPPHPFYFGGFLPRKKQERQKTLEELRSLSATLVFYEAPHRLAQTLRQAADVLGARDAAVARELTKVHEEVRRGSLEELAEHFGKEGVRGECVIVIQGARGHEAAESEQPSPDTIIRALREQITSGRTKKEAIKQVASLYRVGRNEVYRLAVTHLDDPDD